MLRFFVGYDEKETVAYHVLSHSILRHSSIPVSITPLKKENFRGFFSRPRGEYDSTDFAITRFLVPFLCNFEGTGIFMDCDMLVTADVAELLPHVASMTYNEAVKVVKHNYTPATKTKFLDQVQTQYTKKNWSSVMVFNNSLCKKLTPEAVQSAHGLDLHQFRWLNESQLGELPREWNWLVGEYKNPENEIKNYHYTLGTPCFPDYANSEYADLWHAEHKLMNEPS